MRALAAPALAAALFAAGGCGGAQEPTAEADVDTEADTDEGGAELSVKERVDWYLEQAGLARIEGDAAGALDYYLQAAAVCEEEAAVTVQCADVHYEAAGVAYERMKRQIAIEQYQKAIDIYLRFRGNARAKAAVALNAQGVIYREMAEKPKARNAFEQALQVYKETPDEFKNHSNIEKIKQNIRDLDEGYH